MVEEEQREAGRSFTAPTVETLARCDEEPIHRPGAVQPHGCLFEVRGDALTIGCASSNLREALNVGARDVLGKSLAELFGDELAQWAAAQLASLPPATHAARLSSTRDGRPGTVVVHHYAERRFVEWLADAEHRFQAPSKMDETLARTVAALGREPDLSTLLQRITEGVRTATGYDRVMVYRFHPDWHGEIAAESTEPGLSPYRGLHYPASDIPAQARRLYIETRVRVITDVYARDAVLMDGQGDEISDTLDLSHALLRSVSPVHIQYLRNMGSGATLVTSLLVRGRLWGLIACHHRARYAVPFYAFERLRRFTDDAAGAIGERLRAAEAERQQAFAEGRALVADALVSAPLAAMEQLCGLMGSVGAVAFAGSRTRTLGSVPPGAAALAALVLGQPEDVGLTDGLQEQFPAAPAQAGCAGMAWAVLSRPYQAGIVFLRPEFERTVTWGGDPEKAIIRDPVTQRLSPRGSFDLWKQTVRGRSRPWDAENAGLLEFLRGRVDAKTWLDQLASAPG